MLATAGKAFDIDDEDDWAFEMKWDGYRAVAVCDGADVTLFSRTGKDMTDTYPEVADALAAHDLTDTVLDGEVVALGPDGTPSFSRLQQGTRPINYLLFDVLSHDGEALKNATYLERRDVLEDLDLDDGDDAARAAGLRRLARGRRRVEPGARARGRGRQASRQPLPQRHPVVVVDQDQEPADAGGGDRRLASGQGQPVRWRRAPCCSPSRTGDGWRYIGRVGTGFTDRVVDDLTERLKAIERKTPPLDVPRDVAREARWVSPKLVGEVTYGEWTPDGHLRHPVWRGLRPDKKPSDVSSQ